MTSAPAPVSPRVHDTALAAVLTRYALLELFRSPGAIILSVGFPSFIFFVFVALAGGATMNAADATQAAVQMAVFGVFMVGLFSVGIDNARAREDPWTVFLRSLPASALPRVVATLIANGVIALLSVLTLTAVARIFTPATTSPAHLLAGLAALAVAWVPFLLLGNVIAYAFPFKMTLAVMTPVMFVCSALGGLWFAVQNLPAWLEVAVRVLPVRGPKDLVSWAVLGGDLPWWDIANIVGWTAALAAGSVVLMGRDQHRRS